LFSEAAVTALTGSVVANISGVLNKSSLIFIPVGIVLPILGFAFVRILTVTALAVIFRP